MRRRWLLLAALALCTAPAVGAPTVAQASFPGNNGKIAFGRTVDSPSEPRCVYTANSNGTSETPLLGCDSDYESNPRWSPDGVQIAYQGFAGQLDLVNADGSNLREFFFAPGAWTTGHGWSPDATELTVSWFDCFDDGTCGSRLEKLNATTGANTTILNTTDYVTTPDWSPDGTKIAYSRNWQLYSILANGTGETALAPGAPGDNHSPSWSPNGSQIAFVSNRDENEEIYVMNANGTNQTRLTDEVGYEGYPRWSPDGTKIIFESDRDDGNHEIYVMNADGTNQTRITNDSGWDAAPDWQPLPVNSFVRPKNALKSRFPLVPAFNQCTSPNRTHGPPLVNPSCNPPVQSSPRLTIGSPDVNGKSANFSGFVRYSAVAGNAGTPADEADIVIQVQVTDVYRTGALTDYTGELSARAITRLTDRQNNTPNPGGPGAATTADHGLFATVPCVATSDPNTGATCNLLTTADALLPGRVVEGKRSVLALLSVRLDDGGADEDADTLGDNLPFLTQGVFIP
jgi:hypothetical protein